jgi:predicted transcriptional regulator
MSSFTKLSRRERQIMDSVFRRGEASVAEVLADLADPPSYSAIRATMQVLVDKQQLSVRKVGPRYVYRPTISPQKAVKSALRGLLRTFFDDSPAQAMTALLDLSSKQLSDADLERLEAAIQEAKRRAGS